MVELAYMVREDWGQNGTAMVSQSKVIREWMGEAPYLFAVVDVSKVTRTGRSADLDVVNFIAHQGSERVIFRIGELRRLVDDIKVLDHAVVVVHPFDEHELEAIREAVDADIISRLFILLWAPRDRIRTWLDARGALNLHTGKSAPPPDPVMIEAASMMIEHEYNGLSSGHGKETVVQLLRAFAANGYPLEVDRWLRAYFAAGGTFPHAKDIGKLAAEMKAGVRHRAKPRFRDDIFQILQQCVAERGID